MSSTGVTPPPANKVATTTTVDTPLGTVGASALLPSWMAGTYAVLVLIFVLVWVVLYWVGAAKLSYDTSGSAVWAFLAFLFAFFVSKPTPAPMMGGGGHDPISNLFRVIKKFK